MYYTVRKPSHYAEEGAGVGGEDVGEIGAVEDVFESGKDADPDWRAPGARDESIRWQGQRPVRLFKPAPTHSGSAHGAQHQWKGRERERLTRMRKKI